MRKRTPLYDLHLATGAKMVDFSGYDMPINYGSQVAEHEAVRGAAGIFDVSHMLAVDIFGRDVKPYLEMLLSNDVNRLQESGQALYTAMLNRAGGVMDDLIVYRTDPGYRAVLNCGRREADLAWMRSVAESCGFEADIKPRPDLSILALQGPDARDIFCQAYPEAAAGVRGLKPFRSLFWSEDAWLLARTGYTGEDGLEIMVPASGAVDIFGHLLAAGAKPAGLAARDTLRLEAGMNLYGSDMDETVSPLEANMQIALALTDDRQFIGRKALESLQESGAARVFCGLLLQGPGVLRRGQSVYRQGGQVGELVSGAFSPVLRRGIGFCRLVPGTPAEGLEVEIRGKLKAVQAVRPPFVRNGKPVYKVFSSQAKE